MTPDPKHDLDTAAQEWVFLLAILVAWILLMAAGAAGAVR